MPEPQNSLLGKQSSQSSHCQPGPTLLMSEFYDALERSKNATSWETTLKLAAFLKFKHTANHVITDEILKKWTNYMQCSGAQLR